MHRRAITTITPLLLTLLMIVAQIHGLSAAPTLVSSPQATPVGSDAYDPASLLAVKSELRDDIAQAMPAGLTHYTLRATFPASEEDGHVIVGTADIRYTNTTGRSLDALPVRLYANLADDDHALQTIDSAMVDGSSVEPKLQVSNTVALIPFAHPLAAGDAIDISLSFTSRVPTDDNANYNMFSFDSRARTWSLAYWYPIVAGWDAETGFMLDPPSVIGDPVFTNSAIYDVTITAPEDLQLITSGVATGTEAMPNGMVTTTYQAAPSRDFVIIADTDLRKFEQEIDGTTVTAWVRPDHASNGEIVARWMAETLELFNPLLGDYPYRQLQMVDIAMSNASGVEYPQLITVGTREMEAPPDTSEWLEITVVHEMIHQWFYNIVGNNQYRHAFIDEGLTSFISTYTWFAHTRNERAAKELTRSLFESPWRSWAESQGDAVVDTPTDDFASMSAYVIVAYSKAPLGFQAIHDAMGEDHFYAGLQDYVRTWRFRTATPDDLLAALQAHTDVDLQPIWTTWFERAEGED